MPKKPSYTITDRELATVLAALRYWQENVEEGEQRADFDYFDDVKPLNDAQIDRLCERLNTTNMQEGVETDVEPEAE